MAMIIYQRRHLRFESNDLNLLLTADYKLTKPAIKKISFEQ